MFLCNTDFVSGKELKVIGLVRGSAIKSKNFLIDIISGLKFLVGGELLSYSKMMDDTRQLATDRMSEQAARMGADAIINVRYTSSAVMYGAAEILSYGTAVKFV